MKSIHEITELRRTARLKWLSELKYKLQSLPVDELPEIRRTIDRLEECRTTKADNDYLWKLVEQMQETNQSKK